jgi:virginiamycin B lyase
MPAPPPVPVRAHPTARPTTAPLAGLTWYGVLNAEQLVVGPDGLIWFRKQEGKIGYISGAGAITEYRVPPNPDGIAAGPDGNIWFTDQIGEIGRLTKRGTLTEFAIPTRNSAPCGIVAGPDGALWFTEFWGNKIGRITVNGDITEYPISAGNDQAPCSITSGPDRALWFTLGRGGIGRITTSGDITIFPLSIEAYEIISGPDGALWFTDRAASAIGRITTKGVVTGEYAAAPSNNGRSIAVGPDHAIWYSRKDYSDGRVSGGLGRITMRGVVTEYTAAKFHGIENIIFDSAGALWLTDGRVGRLDIGSLAH